MKRLEKIGYTFLGAGILAVGVIIGQLVSPEEQSREVFDKIVCREFELVDQEGNKAVVLQSNDKSNNLHIYDRQAI